MRASASAVVWVLTIAVLLAGCAAGPNADSGAEDAASSSAARAEQARATQAARASVAHQLEAMPEIRAVHLSVITAPGREAAENVSVEVLRASGEPVDAVLAERVVERVLEGFPHLAPSNVAVRDGAEPSYLYVGDLGELD